MKKDLSFYYIDLSKVLTLKEKESERIFSMYQDMLHYMTDNREMVAMSIFNTLEVGGFLKNRQTEERENKLGELING